MIFLRKRLHKKRTWYRWVNRHPNGTTKFESQHERKHFSAFPFGENYENLITTIQFSLVPKLVFLSWLKKASWTFSRITSFSSNPSPSFKRWIKRRSVLEAWTSCTYLWWTVNETRSALFSIKWGLRQNWVCDIWCQCRKSSRRNLVGDSPTEQFLRSRGLGEKQTLPHLVSQHRKNSWASLLE